MDISKLDTSRLKFDPRDADFIRNFDGYPEFNPEPWDFGISRRVALTYVVLMYDPKSEFIDKVPNYWQRKRISAQTAGFPIVKNGDRKGMFAVEEEGILLGQSNIINRMCIRYCLLFHDIEYLTLVSYLELFIQETMNVMELNSTKDSRGIISNINSLNTNIKELTKSIFSGEEGIDMKKELYKSVISEMLTIRPELIAKKLDEKQPPLNSKYEYK